MNSPIIRLATSWTCGAVFPAQGLTSAPQFAGSNLVAKNPQKPKWQHGMGNLPDFGQKELLYSFHV